MKISQYYHPRNFGSKKKFNLYGERSRTTRFLLIIIIILAVATGVGYLIFFPSFLEIKEISVQGTDRVPKEEIERAVRESLNKKIFLFKFEANFLTLSGRKLSKILRETFPQIDLIKISRKPFHSLIVRISERKEVGVWCKAESIKNEKTEEENTENSVVFSDEQMGDCFYIDKKGIIFSHSPELGGSLFLVIKDFSSKEFQLGEKASDEKLINDLIDLRNKITSNMEFKVYEFKIYSPSDLKMSTSEGWEAHFNPSADLEKQYDDLELVLRNKISPEERKTLKYIDLRTERRAYYK